MNTKKFNIREWRDTHLKDPEVLKEAVTVMVWTKGKPRKKTIKLKADDLEQAVSSGHDHNWNDSISDIEYWIKQGDTDGDTKLQRYPGASATDTLYWKLK
tara:strand:- start:42 stop:341 length:300 start_codon:yes stop_codon:yes gene_type:complete